jgi:hypothetical protein
MPAPRLGSLLILTEDGASTGHATVVAVVKRMLQLLVPDCQTHRIGIEPRDEQAQRAVQTIVVARVRQLLRGRPGSTAEDAETRLRRLFPVVPFYSIEAWLFQHTEVAVRLCRERYQGRDVGQFEEWRQARTALDDVAKPKEAVCLKAAHNLECAGAGYPAQKVFEAGRSYAACVERLRACAALNDLLDATAGRPRGTALG